MLNVTSVGINYCFHPLCYTLVAELEILMRDVLPHLKNHLFTFFTGIDIASTFYETMEVQFYSRLDRFQTRLQFYAVIQITFLHHSGSLYRLFVCDNSLLRTMKFKVQLFRNVRHKVAILFCLSFLNRLS